MSKLQVRESCKQGLHFEHKPIEDHQIEEAILAIKPLLSFTPIEIDDIIRTLDLNPSAILTALLALELSGRVVRHPGHKVSLRDEVLFDIA